MTSDSRARLCRFGTRNWPGRLKRMLTGTWCLAHFLGKLQIPVRNWEWSSISQRFWGRVPRFWRPNDFLSVSKWPVSEFGVVFRRFRGESLWSSSRNPTPQVPVGFCDFLVLWTIFLLLLMTCPISAGWIQRNLWFDQVYVDPKQLPAPRPYGNRNMRPKGTIVKLRKILEQFYAADESLRVVG